MKIFGEKEIWLVTGSQHLYGPGVLEQVAKNSQEMAQSFDDDNAISVKIVSKGVVTGPKEIKDVCNQANVSENCIGLMLWMHTFSPAKMWIGGLKSLQKPYMHLHTQFNAGLPWSDINMHYMNLHQSAHGDREFGHIGTRLRQDRKVVVGHWDTEKVRLQIDDWARAAIGFNEAQNLKVARFGDNMRQVAVTEGDKVEAQIKLGIEVHAYSTGDLEAQCAEVSESQIDELVALYKTDYQIDEEVLADSEQVNALRNEARLEIAMETFLTEGGFGAFTNCFENLTGLTGLPGLATQRLMSKGFGYGGEGDWKTAAMVRIFKKMSLGKKGGTSFMEDYTYHFGEQDLVLGAHMLEVCPSIASEKPSAVVAKHTIGIKKDIARLLFAGATGPAMNVSTIDMGNRFRIIANLVDTIEPPEPLPNLPVATALWKPQPSLEVAGAAWIYAGGAHHSAYTQGVSISQLSDFAEMVGVELVVIDNETNLPSFKQCLRNNAVYYHTQQGC
ncbi:L-arabinose isomerase [Alteromonas sp. KUL49]|uniref:L-arabinose isomerase n=1 Tax=Alteromonas sp. KUL49 TaxID=2480798 RepID=UPI00102EEBFF|nr:L-arabinose isomerase [Alteromonas sp. KUL49]TAP39419.1 L-arabinose isomerase [Alteromonas sp. KUL49]GEA12216.1 L-arabinose isomerase [Alteromonas sp. KUL49]